MVEKKTKKPSASAKASADKSSRKTKAAVRKKAAARPARKPSRAPSRPREEEPQAAAVVPGSPEAARAMPVRGIHDLRPASGATRNRKRVGRGPGSGHGKTAGRGSKGQKSRSGYHHLLGFEGGQMPIHRRIPKRGFTNIFRVEYDIVNLSQLDVFDAGASVTPQLLVERRLAHGRRPVKILGDGKLGKALTVAAHKFSAGARAGIEAAGGTCEVISR